MTQLLVLGSTVLMHGAFIALDTEFWSRDIVYPRHVVPGAAVVRADVPEDFTTRRYMWDGTGLVLRPPLIAA